MEALLFRLEQQSQSGLIQCSFHKGLLASNGLSV